MSKKPELFQWRLNPESGEYEMVPIHISAHEFWEHYVNYEDSAFQFWNEIHTPYDWLILDAVDEVIDEMASYPDADRIWHKIRKNTGDSDEN